MSSVLKFVLPSLLAAVPVLAQPSIGGIVNGASYTSAPLDAKSNPVGNNLVAQGAIFVIFGKNMGPTSLVGSSSLPLTTTLPASTGTSVSITGGGKTVSAYMVYTSAGQVAAILPSDTPIGAATVTVSYNGQTSAAASINVVQSGLGVFTDNSQGNGPAIAQVYHVGSTTPGLVALTNSAEPGDTLIVYGTGLGAITGADNEPPGAVSVGTNVTVNIAGTQIPVLYAGRSPNFPGLDQINFKLPSNVSTGCYIPAEITATGQPGNLFYLSIASGSTTCTHPFGLDAASMSTLDKGGTINIGLFLLLAAVELGAPAEGAGGLFDNAGADTIFQMYSRIVFAFGGINFPVAAGSCAVLQTTDPYVAPSVPNLAALGGTELNAGGAVTVTSTGLVGVGGYGIPRLSTGGYETVFFDVLGQGTATVVGTGGPAVGAFTATTTLPANLVWSNVGNLASPPRTGITVTWTGGSVNAQSLVTVFGSSVVINPTDPSKNRGAEFFCNAPASAGMFTIPASTLQQLPSGATLASGEVASGALGINAGGGSSFTAPLTMGTLNAGYLAFGEAQSIPVTYQ
jgi:uncharacterized protein (TIGR03437 family)